jgi:hypothetical protein
MDYDVFISHAYEDKEDLVTPLAHLLSGIGVTVWYDEFSLKVGDSLSRSIDRGLASSRYGVIVISKYFITKPWPEYELRGLVSKEIGRDKVVLPVWYNVTRDEVLNFSPPLVDKLALDASRLSLGQIAVKLLEVIRPELYESLVRYKSFQERMEKGILSNIKAGDLQPGPIRHETLPDSLMVRLALVYQVLEGIVPKPFEKFVEAFQRDLNPAQELQVWEKVAYAYLTFTRRRPFEEVPYAKEILSALLQISMGRVPEHTFKYLSENDIHKLTKLYFFPTSGHLPE